MKNKYSLYENIHNFISLIYTKVFHRKARLIRLPIYIRGKNLLIYGKGFTTGYNCRLEMFNLDSKDSKKIILGDNVKIGDNVHLASGEKVIIGDDCLLASNIYISDISHGSYKGDIQDSPMTVPDARELITNPILIGNRVWIGENVAILPGVSIGDGTIIGANSLVNSSIPENSIAVGIPAKVIKKYDFQKSTWVRV